MVVAPDAADDIVTVKECFQLVEGIRRIPRIRIGRIAGHAAQTDQKKETAPDERIERIDIERMFRQ